jgi:hypothetical protein
VCPLTGSIGCPPGAHEPDGPWPLVNEAAEGLGEVGDEPVRTERAGADGPDEAQQVINQQRIEEAVAVGGRIARGKPVDDPRVIVVARQDRACLALIRTEMLGWPGHGEHTLLVLWTRHSGRWESPSTMSGTYLRADDEVFKTGSTSWPGPDGPTWVYVVGHTSDPATPSKVQLGGREVALTVGRDGYFLGLIQALPGQTADDLDVIDPWHGGWRQAQWRSDELLEAMPGSPPHTLRCSFCGRAAGVDRQLVAGPGIWICGDCAVMADAAARSNGPVEVSRVTITIAPEPSTCPFCGRRTGTADPSHPNRLTLLVATNTAGAAICVNCVVLTLEILREQAPDQ